MAPSASAKPCTVQAPSLVQECLARFTFRSSLRSPSPHTLHAAPAAPIMASRRAEKPSSDGLVLLHFSPLGAV